MQMTKEMWMRHLDIYLAVVAGWMVVAMALALVLKSALLALPWFRHIRRLLDLGGVVDVDDVDADASASVINLMVPFWWGRAGGSGSEPGIWDVLAGSVLSRGS